ncbi:UNVERIFIED_CONTAM: hypothetical protein Slati_3734300 [Sesamum latifolium]|uniref:Uncharacterized protein n=1 Tax=Sesamum latifolium TaxID=2727402 RepID=A0AAW2U739_9LAMI
MEVVQELLQQFADGSERSRNIAEELAATLGVPIVVKHEKYLGLPIVVGQLKHELFESLKTQVQQKLQSWTAKKLSQAGREVLIKLVIQTLPSYAMSCFKILDWVLSELESMSANFFWHQDCHQKIHGLSWNNLYHHKSEGVLTLGV